MNKEDLGKQEAREKLKHLVEDIRIAMMVTGHDMKPFSAVPMTTKRVDPDGSIWFLSGKTSEHNRRISRDDRIHLLYSNPSAMEFISISGTGEISEDRNILEELYDDTEDQWFEGPEDSGLTAIRFYPREAFFWDSRTNKYEALYKLGIAAISGEDKNKGEKGKLNF